MAVAMQETVNRFVLAQEELAMQADVPQAIKSRKGQR
jgi:hypothetical protein